MSQEDSHTAENSLDYWGEYKGMFPAADCPGINISLTLDYIDRNSKFTESGSYMLECNLLTLDSGKEVQY